MSTLVSLLLLACPQGTPFTEADMHALLAEIATVAPQHPDYTYPVQARYKPEATVNAWTFLEVRESDGALIPQLELFRGIVELAGGDRDVIRAILAHEMAHLSLGHSLEGFGLNDLANHHSRFQEQEADRVGAEYLAALGHGKEDMIAVLLMLDEFTRENHVPWLDVVGSDHTSPIARAAALSGDAGVFEALRVHEIGLAYMECRQWRRAIELFDRAYAMEPRLHEAALNAASAALQDYYDWLPPAVQDEWLRPEFGPLLTDTNLHVSRAIAFTDADRARYAEALRRIEAVPDTLYPRMKTFLRGTALVLAPQDEEKGLREGVRQLEGLFAAAPAGGGWAFDFWRLSCANNAALGMQRLGEGARGMKLLITEQRADMRYLPSAAENLGRLPHSGLTKEEAGAAIAVLVHYLKWTPPGAPGVQVATRALGILTAAHGFVNEGEVSTRPILLCQALAMRIGGRDVALFDSFGEVSQALGEIPAAGTVNERFAGLRFLIWGDNAVIGIADEEDVLLKLTSYVPGTELVLTPRRDSGIRQGVTLRVGMSEADFRAAIAPAGGDQLGSEVVYLLSRRSFGGPDGESLEEENWLYYPTLNFGVTFADGMVAGISVTPIVLPE